MSRRRLVSAAILALVLVIAVASVALADGAVAPNPGMKLGQWITDNVTALFAPVLAAVSLYYLAKRQFTKFLSFAVFAAAVTLLVFATGDFKDFAINIGKWVLSK
jgi:hypothetical protein